MKYVFINFSRKVSHWTGTPIAFFLSLLIVIVWAALGPYFNWTNAHQLFINTFTTVVTYILVFIIQNTQNRETKAMQLKLDELIRVTKARNKMIIAEELSEKDLEKISQEFRHLAE